MMGVRQKEGQDEFEGIAEINVTPLVDVFLVLLVIFMITAPVIKTAIEMGLPQAQTAQTDPSQGITVKVMPDRTIWIDEERVTMQAFPDRFRAVWSELGPDKKPRPVFLAADKGVPYGEVVYVLDELRAAGVDDLGLLTRKDVEKSRKK